MRTSASGPSELLSGLPNQCLKDFTKFQKVNLLGVSEVNSSLLHQQMQLEAVTFQVEGKEEVLQCEQGPAYNCGSHRLGRKSGRLVRRTLSKNYFDQCAFDRLRTNMLG
jgi:hypothetical protein